MKRLLAALLAFGACGEASKNTPDPYYGTVDTTAFDSRFLPSTDKTRCPNGPCYPYQFVYEGGKQHLIFDFGATPTKNFPVDGSGNTIIPVSLANPAFQFTTCAPTPYDTFADAFDPSMQYPILSKLPLASTNTKAFILPLAAVSATAVGDGVPCNAIKNASSIGPSIGPPGKYGAEATDTIAYDFWVPIDMTASLPSNAPLKPAFAWYRGLQTAYLDGGQVPLDSTGQNFLYMDGVLTNPGNGYFAKPTDQNVVILPFKPGDPGYSPIVKLHDYDLAAHGRAVQDITGICQTPPCACPMPGVMCDVALSDTSGAFNTIFIIWGEP